MLSLHDALPVFSSRVHYRAVHCGGRVSDHHLSTLRLATEPLSGRRLVYARCRTSSRRTVRLAWKSAFRSVSFAQLRVYRWRLHPDRFGLEDTLRRPARRRAGDDGHLWLDPSPAISRLHTRDVDRKSVV